MTRTWCGNGRGRLDRRRLFRREGVLSSLSQALIVPFSGGSMLGLPGRRLPSAEFLLLLPFLLLLLLPAAPAPHRAAYKPVIVVHGLFDSSYSFRHLLEYINEVWQGTPRLWGVGGGYRGWGGRMGNWTLGLPSFSRSWCWRGENWGARDPWFWEGTIGMWAPAGGRRGGGSL